MKEMKLQLEGITCAGCAEDIEKILRDTKGILDATVNFADEIIYIRYDPVLIDRKQVYLAARKLGNVKKIISES